jgi:lipid-binding SYLF domain-containing protein
MFKRNQYLVMAFTFLLLIGSLGVRTVNAKETANDERERAQKAATVLSEIMGIKEGGIPNDLMSHAEAIAVFPHMVKGGFIVGGEYGKGLVSDRMSNGQWSTPAFIKIGGGSFGLQIGAEATDLVLVFTSKEGFKGLLEGKLKLGADAAVAAGPVGRDAQVGTDVLLKSPVLAYSRSKRVYGKELTAEDILYNGRARMNDMVSPFVRELDNIAPARKHVTD